MFPHANPEKHDHRCLRFYTKTFREAYPEAEVEWIEAFGRVMEKLLKGDEHGVGVEEEGVDTRVEVDDGENGKGKEREREREEAMKATVQGDLGKRNGVDGGPESEMEVMETEAVGTKGVEENKMEKAAKKPRWRF